MPATTTPTSPFHTWWSQRPPTAGAAVMATGILSVALHQAGYETLSRIALALACASWLALTVDFTARLLRDRARWMKEAATPAALTAIAATTVLGTRFTTLGWETLAKALLALAALLWPGLLIAVVRHWHPRMPGAVFLGCVATEGLAVLGATLAATVSSAWLAHAALVLFWLGLVLYLIALTRFDLRQVVHGAGDHWVAGGALAISALAGSKLIAADSNRLYLWNDDDISALRTVTVALLVLDLAWYAALLLAEIAWPRLRYDVRRWATVFPMGMTAAAALSVATAVDVPWLKTPGEVLLWIAVAAWLAVTAGAVWAYTHPGYATGVGPGTKPATTQRPTSRPQHGNEDVRHGQQPHHPEQTLVHRLVVPLHIHEPEDHDQQRQLHADLDVVDGLVVRLIEADEDHPGDQHGQSAVQHRGDEPGGALAHRLHLGEETTEQRGDTDDVQADEEVDEYVHGAGA